jgi:hypothetical protein
MKKTHDAAMVLIQRHAAANDALQLIMAPGSAKR